LFTSLNGSGSTLTKFDPVAKKESFLMTLTQHVVGVGGSSCAPL
jgi:hypothetical protein